MLPIATVLNDVGRQRIVIIGFVVITILPMLIAGTLYTLSRESATAMYAWLVFGVAESFFEMLALQALQLENTCVAGVCEQRKSMMGIIITITLVII